MGDKGSNLFDNGRAYVVITRTFSISEFCNDIKYFFRRGRMEEDGFLEWCLKEIMKVDGRMNLIS